MNGKKILVAVGAAVGLVWLLTRDAKADVPVPIPVKPDAPDNPEAPDEPDGEPKIIAPYGIGQILDATVKVNADKSADVTLFVRLNQNYGEGAARISQQTVRLQVLSSVYAVGYDSEYSAIAAPKVGQTVKYIIHLPASVRYYVDYGSVGGGVEGWKTVYPDYANINLTANVGFTVAGQANYYSSASSAVRKVM
jgi:hypothetical protein